MTPSEVEHYFVHTVVLYCCCRENNNRRWHMAQLGYAKDDVSNKKLIQFKGKKNGMENEALVRALRKVANPCFFLFFSPSFPSKRRFKSCFSFPIAQSFPILTGGLSHSSPSTYFWYISCIKNFLFRNWLRDHNHSPSLRRLFILTNTCKTKEQALLNVACTHHSSHEVTTQPSYSVGRAE